MDHLTKYRDMAGREGHIIDTTAYRNPRFTPTLLLRTRGRKTGRVRLVPLAYGLFGREWVLVGTDGGRPDHTAWYLNLREQPECEIRIATQVFRCAWREAEGEERSRIWAYICELYPIVELFGQICAPRVAPVIMLLPLAEIPAFTE
jgi:deazaflavin-dependent oxidoreductase (nitroreductase family)